MGPARLRTMRVVHAALVASLLIYAGLVHLLAAGPGWRGTAPEVARPLRWIFYALGAVELVGVLIARSRLLDAESLIGLARRAGTEAALAQLQARTIVLLAVAESVAIYGLVLFVLTGEPREFYVLAVPSLLVQLALAPRAEVWEAVGRVGPRP